MHGFDDTPARTFDPLTRSQCVHLLETHSLGRLAWQAADSQQVRPINYVSRSVRRTAAFRPAILDRSTLAIRLPNGDGGASTARQETQL
jgi:hypothetical protein